MNLAEFVSQFLTINGISRVFGLPGGENVVFIEALRKTGIYFVLFHHETSAGFAAGVTGQLTGLPGVCLSTVGPGAVNLVASAASATLERSPMLAITADIDTDWQPRVAHMKMDLFRLFSAVAKESINLTPENVNDSLVRAWHLALTPPRGSVHLAIAPDIATSPVSGMPEGQELRLPVRHDSNGLSGFRMHMQAADDMIAVVGLGVEEAGAQDELRRLAEAWQIPVAATPKAKGHFPESHPLFLGCFTAYGDGPLRKALTDADLILGIGLDSVDFVTSTWDFETPLITLNHGSPRDPALKPVTAVNGNLKESLKDLSEIVDQERSPKADKAEVSAAIRSAVAQELVAGDQYALSGTVRVSDLVHGLRISLPQDGAVTIDVGVFKLLFLQQWLTDYPKSLFVSNGLSAMGYAVPGALAVKLEQPGRTVVAVVGDGALLMYAGELATIAREEQPLVILVVVDNALSLIRLKQLRHEVPIHGTEFDRVDYRELASAHGLRYRLIDSQGSIKAVLDDAIGFDGTILVEARVNREEYNHFL